jgi:hypothetical protein
MHLAPLGNAQQYCSVYNFQSVFRGFFSVYPALPNNEERFGAAVGNAHYKGQKKHGSCGSLFILLYWGGNGNT